MIPTADPWSATKLLGVMYNVMNICKHQVQFIRDKGTVWTSRLNSDAHISKRDAWKSFFFLITALTVLFHSYSVSRPKVSVKSPRQHLPQ